MKKPYGKSPSQQVLEHIRLLKTEEVVVLRNKTDCDCRCEYYNINGNHCSKYKIKLINSKRCDKCLEEFIK